LTRWLRGLAKFKRLDVEYIAEIITKQKRTQSSFGGNK